jgi:hypothetical protein
LALPSDPSSLGRQEHGQKRSYAFDDDFPQ